MRHLFTSVIIAVRISCIVPGKCITRKGYQWTGGPKLKINASYLEAFELFNLQLDPRFDANGSDAQAIRTTFPFVFPSLGNLVQNSLQGKSFARILGNFAGVSLPLANNHRVYGPHFSRFVLARRKTSFLTPRFTGDTKASLLERYFLSSFSTGSSLTYKLYLQIFSRLFCDSFPFREN